MLQRGTNLSQILALVQTILSERAVKSGLGRHMAKLDAADIDSYYKVGLSNLLKPIHTLIATVANRANRRAVHIREPSAGRPSHGIGEDFGFVADAKVKPAEKTPSSIPHDYYCGDFLGSLFCFDIGAAMRTSGPLGV